MKFKSLVFCTVVAIIGAMCIMVMNTRYDVLARYPWRDMISDEQAALISDKLDQKGIDYIIDYQIDPGMFMDFIEADGFNIYYSADYRKIYDVNGYKINTQYTVWLVNLYKGKGIETDKLNQYLINGYSYDELVFYIGNNNGEELIVNPNEVTLEIGDNQTIGNYQPKDLVLVENIPQEDADAELYLRAIARDALSEMCSALETEFNSPCGGLQLQNAYMSYEQLYQIYAQHLKGTTVTSAQSWDPGKSDFQLGLAVDFSLRNHDQSYLDSETYLWLLDNAHNYGFVQPYSPAFDKEFEMTAAESDDFLHFRYLGREKAGELYRQPHSGDTGND